MRFSYFRYGKILLAVLLICFTASAQNVNDAVRVGLGGLGSNARALGMGNSYIALSDDASASFFNPAGFGLLKRMELSGGLNYISYNNETSFLGKKSSSTNSSTNLNRVSFAFPFPTVRGSLVFGLSYHSTTDFTTSLKFDGFNSGPTSRIQSLLNTNVPYDLYLTDDDNNTPIMGLLNQSGDITNSGSIDNWTLSGAIEAHKNLFIGVNVNIISGRFESISDYYEDDTQNIYQGETAAGYSDTDDFKTFYLNNILDWDIAGWDAKIGMLYQFHQYARFGLTLQFPKTFVIKEKFDVAGRSIFGTGFIAELNRDDYRDEVEFDIVTPFELAGGFSINFRGLVFSVQGSVTDYTQMKFSNAKGLTPQYIASVNKDIKDQLRTTFNINTGIEYTIPQIELRLRGGFFTQQSPFKDDPSTYNRKYLTGGIGFLTDETIGIDLAYARGWWKTHGDNYGNGESRTFQDIVVHQFILTSIYRF